MSYTGRDHRLTEWYGERSLEMKPERQMEISENSISQLIKTICGVSIRLLAMRLALAASPFSALAGDFTLRVIDSETKLPLPVRVYVENRDAGTRHFVRAFSETSAVIYERQNWANKNSIEHHTSVPAAPFVAEQLPAGTYEVTIERGKEYFPKSLQITLKENESRQLEVIELRRWVDMSERNWFSGETHIHRPLQELPVVLQAEDLNVAMPLTYWVTKAFTAPTQGNKNQTGEIPDRLIMVDRTHVIWPRNTEYEIFSVGEHRHTLGALFVLNHRSVLDLGVPEWKPVAERARSEGALLDMDKLDWPFSMTLPSTTGATLYELANNHMWRTEFGLTKWNTFAPAFLQPPRGGTEGDERDWLAYTLGQYYTLLNAGFPLVPTAGTASGVHPVPAGFSRVYVKLDGPFNYEDWLAGLRAGRSFVTTGPMLLAEIDGKLPGELFRSSEDYVGPFKLTGKILSEFPLEKVEVITNGRITASLSVASHQTPQGAWRCDLNADIPVTSSGWVCLRCTEQRPDRRLRFAHTAPWRFEVPGKPLRPSQQEKDYLIRRVSDEIDRSREVLPSTALREYQAALRHFQQLQASDVPAVLPQTDRVDAQPLLLQIQRLAEALKVHGAPLPPETLRELELLEVEKGEVAITAAVQRLLDPLCIAAVEIPVDEALRVTAGQTVEVEEQGWRTMLVKVLNSAGVQSRLRSDSPQARPIPHGPQQEIANRWLLLNALDGRPLDANLSGLALEYRMLQVSSTTPGKRSARLEFSTAGTKQTGDTLIREWRFQKDTDGWGQPNDLNLDVRDGSLHLTSTSNDPYLSAPVEARGGKLILKFWARTESKDIGQVFWWTEQLPQPDGQRQVNFPLSPGRGQEYSVELPVEGELRGVRIDPLQGPGSMQIDWISLEYAAGESGRWAGTDVSVRTVASTPVTFQVRDADGTPCMGCFEIRDAAGRVYPAQPKRQAPDFFFQTQIYRESGERMRLPVGQYTVVCSHGPESVPETKTLTIGDQPVTLEYQVQRWIDTAKLGYWSGDHHIHAAGCLHYENPTQGVHPPEMLRHIMGEDVKVGCCLTWGPCFDYQKQFFRGRPDDVSRYPYLLRYDVEVSGFGSHRSGHLNLLKLRDQIPKGGDSKGHWPTLGLNTLRWAKRQGAVTGTAHSGAGLERSVGRVAGTDGPHKLPCHDIPAFDGIGANEFIMQVTHQVEGKDGEQVPAIDFIATMNTPREQEWNIWYHVLNCGIPVVASGETDFPCMSGERVGMGRVYVKLPGLLHYDDWAEALRRGESYVSNGTSHLLEFQQMENGSFQVQAAARLAEAPEIDVELIANGRPIEILKTRADGQLRILTFKSPQLDHSAWFAVRTFPSAHTNPIWVKVADRPVRVRSSIQWCQAALKQCWREKQPTYAQQELPQAKADYEHARNTYERMLDEIP
jgi:hypothetical protein